MENKKRIAILGSTGSIGTQAIDIIKNNRNKFVAEVLIAGSNSELLAKQARELEPNIVIIADKSRYEDLKSRLNDLEIKVFAGNESIYDIVQMNNIDIVLAAMVGFAGLKPVIRAIEAGKLIALANKETLVVAGEMITDKLKTSKSALIPVDSEHSAIFQCLNGEDPAKLKKIILTASGGPFRNKDITEIEKATPAEALAHPNWEMGKKVSIDSASMMNKGLEVIEAHWLFNMPADKIEVTIHPESIIHSMVEFIDGSMKAQLGNTDMRLPIQYAFSWPERIKTHVNGIDLNKISQLNFSYPDYEKFPNLNLAYQALKSGGNAPCILNASNEAAVNAFLKNKIKFIDIANINNDCLEQSEILKPSHIDEFFESDKQARLKANELVKNYSI